MNMWTAHNHRTCHVAAGITAAVISLLLIAVIHFGWIGMMWR